MRLIRLWRMSARDFRLLLFAMTHADRPVWLLPAVLALGFYALEPFNIAIPLLGAVDDLVVLPLMLHLLLMFLPATIRSGFVRRAR
jgi:uncharacterized membrane protein YkvA (DUF1232 family)